jgi:hypothetical protein
MLTQLKKGTIMAKRKIVGYFQATEVFKEDKQKNVVYFLVAERKAWDESGEMEDFLDEKVYKALPDEFTEYGECVFESPYSIDDTVAKLVAAGFDEQVLTEEINDWI